MRKRILFISRKYPPSIGGMQTYTKNLVTRLKHIYDVDAILLGKGQAHLFWFLPYAFIMSIFLSAGKRYDIFYMGDALLAPLGLFLKKLFKGKAIVTVHGLDITYANRAYQRFIPKAVSKFDKVICVSRNTMEECRKRGIPSSICSFIPNGLNPDEYYLNIPREECIRRLEGALKIDLKDKKILLTAGRLVKRKGIDWFVKNVFSALGGNFIYLVCGKGPLKGKIEEIIENNKALDGRVALLGEVDGGILKLLYNCADIFIMPNQRLDGDAEGFGIVAIEAASCGVPVIANSVEGINEAVLEGKTGWLINQNSVDGFLEKIKNPALHRDAIKDASSIFSWENIIAGYRDIIEQC